MKYFLFYWLHLSSFLWGHFNNLFSVLLGSPWFSQPSNRVHGKGGTKLGVLWLAASPHTHSQAMATLVSFRLQRSKVHGMARLTVIGQFEMNIAAHFHHHQTGSESARTHSQPKRIHTQILQTNWIIPFFTILARMQRGKQCSSFIKVSLMQVAHPLPPPHSLKHAPIHERNKLSLAR